MQTVVRAGEVVGAAVDPGPRAAPPVAVEVRVHVGVTLGGLDEHEAVPLGADGRPGDPRVVRVLPAGHVGADDSRRGRKGGRRDEAGDEECEDDELAHPCPSAACAGDSSTGKEVLTRVDVVQEVWWLRSPRTPPRYDGSPRPPVRWTS